MTEPKSHRDCPDTKKCRVCGVEKAQSEYHKDKTMRCNHASICKTCAYEREKGRTTPEERNSYQKSRYKNSTRGRANMLLQAAKSRARKRGQEFTITMDWVEDRLLSGVCEVTGMKLTMDVGGPRAPSLDKIDPTKGYTPDNTRIVSWFYNRAKGAESDSEARRLILEVAEALQ